MAGSSGDFGGPSGSDRFTLESFGPEDYLTECLLNSNMENKINALTETMEHLDDRLEMQSSEDLVDEAVSMAIQQFGLKKLREEEQVVNIVGNECRGGNEEGESTEWKELQTHDNSVDIPLKQINDEYQFNPLDLLNEAIEQAIMKNGLYGASK